jgi:hypothetical protein
MATRTRPFVVTGAALASAAAVVMATPDLVSTRDLSIASAPSPTRLSSANYELTALSDISVQGINDAYWFGWGGYLTNDNEYYPNILNNSNGGQPIYVSGVSGVLYYVVDNVLDQFSDSIDLDNYYFEVGLLNYGVPNANYSGLGALIYVGTGELFGTDSPIFQAVKTVFYYGITQVINSTIVTLSTALVPEITLGPVTVGGGILASLYYYGVTPDQSFIANSNGLPAIWSYISTALTGLVPTAAATSSEVAPAATATALAAAAESATDEVAGTAEAKTGIGSVKSVAAPAVEVAATAVDAAPAAEPTAEVAKVVSEAPAADAAAVEAPAADKPAADAPAAEAPAADSPAVDAPAAERSAADAPASDANPVAKPAKPKAQSPVGKLAGKIRSALGGGNGGKHRADGSKSSGSSSESGSDASGADK